MHSAGSDRSNTTNKMKKIKMKVGEQIESEEPEHRLPSS